jgi:hypothetical protein
MRGQVLQAEAAGGVLLGSDGNRYTFETGDWKGPAAPAAGTEVDFITDGSAARDIFPVPGRGPGNGTGWSGAQRAASGAGGGAGQPAPGGSSVVLGSSGIVCLLLGVLFPIVVPTIVALILGLIGADSGKRHSNDTGLLLSRIAWIGAAVLIVLGIVTLILIMIFAWPLLALGLEILAQIMDQSTTVAGA